MSKLQSETRLTLPISIFEFEFRVSISSLDFDFRFRVSIADFDLGFYRNLPQICDETEYSIPMVNPNFLGYK